MQEAADVIQEMADPDANVIFGTSKDQKLDDELKVTMVAAAFPVIQDNMQHRDENLRKLLKDAIPEEKEDLEIPSFMRRQTAQKSRGFFR